MKLFTYYFTCLISGIVELGAVLWGIGSGYSVIAALGLALAYQAGNILCFFVNKKISKAASAIIFATFCLSVALVFLEGHRVFKYIVALFAFALLSTMLQNMRSAVQGTVPRWQKRSFRVLGFLLSAVMYQFGAYCLAILTLIMFILSLFTPGFSYDRWLKKVISGGYGENRICWAMVSHQAHYFAYNYVMLMIVMAHYLNPLIATLWFIGNWIPYTITEPLIKLTKFNNWLAIVICAHLFNAAILLGMYMFLDVNIVVALCLWIFTGFGGGNVFSIRKALARRKEYDQVVWSFSEQVGHIVGVVSALIVYWVCMEMKVTLITGAVFALATIPVTCMTLLKAKRKDSFKTDNVSAST